MEREKNEILEMKLKDVLGLKVTFKSKKTNKINIGIIVEMCRAIGIIVEMCRANRFLTLFTIKNAKGEYHEWIRFEDIQLIAT
jgi:hypothetical protein